MAAPPRTHDLVALLLLLLPHDATLGKLRRGLRVLNPYAVDIRYPIKDTTKQEANAALAQAEKVRAAIRQRLGLAP